jgi:hypothetical protein
MVLERFPDHSRIWIYTSNRPVSDSDQREMEKPVAEFLDQWAAHGNQLTAGAAWLNSYQMAVALDETAAGASGCSIDAQTRFMRKIGEEYSIDWFDRMSMIIEEDGEIRRVSFFELAEHPSALLYDGLVQRLSELRAKWPVPLTESRYKHLVR